MKKHVIILAIIIGSFFDLSAQNPFVTTWVTSDGYITIPTNDEFGTLFYEYDITWTNLDNPGVGDGSWSDVQGDYTISNLSNGDTYQVEITGFFPRIDFLSASLSRGDEDKIMTIEQWGNIQWSSMENAFRGCSNLTSSATDAPDLSGVTSLANMFRGCDNFNGSINNWELDNVTNLENMFFDAKKFNQPLDNWEVKNVTNMNGMFDGAIAFNQSLNSWNVSSVTTMRSMFDGAVAFNQPLNNWMVGSVKDMWSMFLGAELFNQPLNNWNVSSVTDMENMFSGAHAFNQPLDNWDVSSVENMVSMFNDASSFNQPLNDWIVNSATDMTQMFNGASSFNRPLNKWNVGNVIYMRYMFEEASSFNQPIGSWDVSSVIVMDEMFHNASSFNQSLGDWDISSATDMAQMLNNSGLSVNNYDATLTGWAAKSPQSNVELGASGLNYCTAESARNTLVNSYNWIIIDEEKDCTIKWSGTAWSNTSGPTAPYNASIEGDFTGAFECNHLTVTAGNALTVDGTLTVNGDLTNAGAMTIASGSSLITYDGHTIADNITFERNTRYADGKYSFVGTPIEQSANITGTDLGNYIYKYDETQSSDTEALARWVNASTDELVPGRGYTQANQQLISFEGRPNDGSLSYSATYVNDGYHLVSNPYPAALDIEAFINGNSATQQTIYIWDDNGSDNGRGSNSDYIVVTKTGATDNNGTDNTSRWNGHIGSMQGFFVKMDGSSGSIAFTESMRVSDNNADENFFRTRQNATPLVRINLTNDQGIFSQAIIGWNETVTNNKIAKGYDGRIFELGDADVIYTTKAKEALAIQTITSSKEIIPLSYRVAEPGVYTIRLDFEEAQGQMLYLRDNLTRETIDASDGYSFNTKGGLVSNRFELVSNHAKIVGLSPEEVQIYAQEQTIYISIPKDNEGRTFRLLDMQGRQILKRTLSSSAQIHTNLRSGMYIVTDGLKSYKIILK